MYVSWEGTRGQDLKRVGNEPRRGLKAKCEAWVVKGRGKIPNSSRGTGKRDSKAWKGFRKKKGKREAT